MLDLHSKDQLAKAPTTKVRSQIKSDDTIEKKKLQGIDTNTLTLMMNAKVLVQHKEYELALNLLRRASNSYSKHSEILKNLGMVLEKLGKWSEAKIVYSELASQFNNFKFAYKKAHIHYMLNEDESALNAYYDALSHLQEEEEDLFELYKNMGNIFVRSKDFDAAEESYNKAYTINPKSDTLLINFGTLEVQREDFDKALFCFRQAIELNAENDKAWIGLALVHNHFGDLELAWANIVKALDIDVYNKTAVILMGHWGQNEEKIKISLEHHKNYLTKFEFDEDITLQLIHIYTQLDKLDSAECEALKLCLWSPKNESFHLLLNQIKEKNKNAKSIRTELEVVA